MVITLWRNTQSWGWMLNLKLARRYSLENKNFSGVVNTEMELYSAADANCWIKNIVLLHALCRKVHHPWNLILGCIREYFLHVFFLQYICRTFSPPASFLPFHFYEKRPHDMFSTVWTVYADLKHVILNRCLTSHCSHCMFTTDVRKTYAEWRNLRRNHLPLFAAVTRNLGKREIFGGKIIHVT